MGDDVTAPQWTVLTQDDCSVTETLSLSEGMLVRVLYLDEESAVQVASLTFVPRGQGFQHRGG